MSPTDPRRLGRSGSSELGPSSSGACLEPLGDRRCRAVNWGTRRNPRPRRSLHAAGGRLLARPLASSRAATHRSRRPRLDVPRTARDQILGLAHPLSGHARRTRLARLGRWLIAWPSLQIPSQIPHFRQPAAFTNRPEEPPRCSARRPGLTEQDVLNALKGVQRPRPAPGPCRSGDDQEHPDRRRNRRVDGQFDDPGLPAQGEDRTGHPRGAHVAAGNRLCVHRFR